MEQSNSEYVSLEKIQTIRSNGLEKQEDYINNIFVKFSRLMSKASGEVELIIAVLGGIIAPLKKYCDGEWCNKKLWMLCWYWKINSLN